MKLNPEQTVASIAKLIKAEYEGDSKHVISGLNEIHVVEKGDLTFVDHPKYYAKALQSAATTILINKKVECPAGKALIFSEDPLSDFIMLTRYFRPFEPAQKMISETAKIGKGTIIQPNVFIGNHVKIGKNCLIHPNVSIYDYTEIGDDVIIHSGTVIGADAFYYQKRNNKFLKFYSSGRVLINNNVEIGANSNIDKGVTGDTIIGEYTKIDNHVHVGHDTTVGKRCLFAAHVGIAGTVTIEDDVILWGQAGVSKDLTIGKGAIVYAQSGVSKTLEGGKIYFGSPAQEARTFMKEKALIRQMPYILKCISKQNIDVPYIRNIEH